ncbi:hypothetical protein [Paracoccus mutanolyticus]|uniref:hypothetical protein n=1 Tax=Paracoccus mutanolyticus TaxID=1499308 RepID=UPI001672BCFC|nr:hypothetical protein [Paracoccus mutanolyticus]
MIDAHLAELNLNPADRRLRLTLELARQLMGAPRHLSQHPGGFVLTHDRLDDLVPIEPAAMQDRQIIEWADDIDALRFMKVDVLALGMLSCMRRGLDLLRDHKDIALDLASIPAEDPRTYAMIRRADTLGTFQIESRAQMAMLPRLRPRTFYDLVVQVAIVRPGPIQGDMVHPYLRRRAGLSRWNPPASWKRCWEGARDGDPDQAMRAPSTARASRRARPTCSEIHGHLKSSGRQRLSRQADRGHGGARLPARLRQRTFRLGFCTTLSPKAMRRTSRWSPMPRTGQVLSPGCLLAQALLTARRWAWAIPRSRADGRCRSSRCAWPGIARKAASIWRTGFAVRLGLPHGVAAVPRPMRRLSPAQPPLPRSRISGAAPWMPRALFRTVLGRTGHHSR